MNYQQNSESDILKIFSMLYAGCKQVNVKFDWN